MNIDKKRVLPASKGHGYWVKMIESYEGSDLTQRAFCETHDLAYSTFTRWLRKIRSEKTPPMTKFRLVGSVDEGLFGTKKGRSISPPILKGPPVYYEVTFKNGACLRIPGSASLKELIEALA